MLRHSVVSMLVLIAVTPACKKKDDAAGGGGSAAAAAPKAECAPDAVKETAGGFCVKVPAKWHELPVKDFAGKKQYQWKDEFGNHEVGVDVGPYDGNQQAFDNNVAVTTDMVKAKTNFAATDIPGGKFYSYQDDDGIWSSSLSHNAKSTFECHTRESPTDKSPDVPTVNAACKTVVSL